MTDTPKLGITKLDPGQSQKHVTVNEAFVFFDAVVQLNVIDKDLTAAPGSPTEGDTYIVASGATGVWAGHDDKIAYYDGSGWIVIQPLAGWLAFVIDEDTPYRYNGGWLSLAGILGADYLPLAGGTMTGDLIISKDTPRLEINTTSNSAITSTLVVKGARTASADAVSQISFLNNLSGGVETNGTIKAFQDDRLEYDSTSHLFMSGGTTKAEVNQHGLGVGGAAADATNAFAFYGTNLLLNSGGSIDLKYNKNASGDDASMTFQQGFNPKALLGLLGNNDFTLKVGASFITAMIANETTGEITMPGGYNTGTSAGDMGGKLITISGEEDTSLSVGQYMAMGNGSVATAGLVMPFDGHIVAATMSIAAGAAGVSTMSVAVNKVENTSYQVSVNYSGSGVDTGVTNFLSSPLAVSAGDAVTMRCAATVGSSDVVTTLFIIVD